MSFKFVFLSDTHDLHNKVVVPEGDFLIHAGDFSSRGTIGETLDFLDWFEKQPHKHKIFISGNHDWLGKKDPFLFREFLKERAPNCHYLEDSGVQLEGINFYGSPWQPEFCGWAWNLPRGEALKEKWDLIPETTDVLITHGPPYGILDQLMDGERVGCKDLDKRIAKVQPKIHAFGHIHHSQGFKTVDAYNMIAINAAICDERYRPTNPPIVLEWD